MKILPYRNYKITTELSKEQIYNVLNENILEKVPRKSTAIQGKVEIDQFEIYELKPQYDESYSGIAQLRGEVFETNAGSSIDIKIRLPKLLAGFMGFWLTGVFVFMLLWLHLYFSKEAESLLGFYIPAAMFVFGALFITLPFHIMAKMTLNKLKEILDLSDEEVNEL